jgi:hypothetical protein
MGAARAMKDPDSEAVRELRRIPGVGVSVAGDLIRLGIRRVADLRGRDPEVLYQDLCVEQGVHVDRCMLYTFRCAVYFASAADPDPELLRWWAWKDRPLPAGMVGAGR